MIRYNARPGTLEPAVDGQFVEYAVAKRDIERLGNELFSARAQLATLEIRRQTDIAVLNKTIDEQRERMMRAAHELGYCDDY